MKPTLYNRIQELYGRAMTPGSKLTKDEKIIIQLADEYYDQQKLLGQQEKELKSLYKADKLLAVLREVL